MTPKAAAQQPLALHNQRCHLNCLWWSQQYGLKFAWTLMWPRPRYKGRPFVHAVCLDANGEIVDPTLGSTGAEYYDVELLDEPVPTSVADADRGLAGLQKVYERRWWQIW